MHSIDALFELWQADPAAHENALGLKILQAAKRVATDEDAVAETCVQVWQSLATGKYRHDGRLEHYVTFTARANQRSATRSFAREGKRSTILDEGVLIPAEPAIGFSLAGIVDPVTKALALRILNGETISDGAAACGISRQNAHRRLRGLAED